MWSNAATPVLSVEVCCSAPQGAGGQAAANQGENTKQMDKTSDKSTYGK